VLSRTDESLARWTTLRLGGPAARFVEVGSRGELYQAVATADEAGEDVLVLGGGSNLVIPDEGFSGTVVHVASDGVEVSESGPKTVEVTAEAGEDWDGLVARAVDEGWSGIEALSGIPGTVGATPIQNVGAYGQEVSATICCVHAFDRVDRAEVTMLGADCEWDYRTSRFKREPGRYVIGAVTFRFAFGAEGPAIQYAELARGLDVGLGQRVPSREVREAVLALRRSKGMVLDESDHDTWSAGSFFTNPFVSASRLPAGAPSYPGPPGLVKVSAAWLVEHAGMPRGYGDGRVALSSKHALALTNRGGATTAELLTLARDVRDRVEAAFGIRLEPEPTLLNLHL
jgi:UDP-N-acetylmuramate dehydrogenase